MDFKTLRKLQIVSLEVNFFQFYLKKKLHWIYLSVWQRNPGGDPILTQDHLISENWTPSTLTHTAVGADSVGEKNI